jgi:hypothetical protein
MRGYTHWAPDHQLNERLHTLLSGPLPTSYMRGYTHWAPANQLNERLHTLGPWQPAKWEVTHTGPLTTSEMRGYTHWAPGHQLNERLCCDIEWDYCVCLLYTRPSWWCRTLLFESTMCMWRMSLRWLWCVMTAFQASFERSEGWVLFYKRPTFSFNIFISKLCFYLRPLNESQMHPMHFFWPGPIVFWSEIVHYNRE